jgi:hypothetical protein
MVALVIGSNSQRLGQSNCQSWVECAEWIDSFITWHGLNRSVGHVKANGQYIVWVKETAI